MCFGTSLLSDLPPLIFIFGLPLTSSPRLTIHVYRVRLIPLRVHPKQARTNQRTRTRTAHLESKQILPQIHLLSHPSTVTLYLMHVYNLHHGGTQMKTRLDRASCRAFCALGRPLLDPSCFLSCLFASLMFFDSLGSACLRFCGCVVASAWLRGSLGLVLPCFCFAFLGAPFFVSFQLGGLSSWGCRLAPHLTQKWGSDSVGTALTPTC